MLERMLIAASLVLSIVAAYSLLRRQHMRLVSRAVAARSNPALLYFRSDSCAPCVAQWRFVQQAQAQYADQVTIEKIDADVEPEKAAQFGVFTLPTTLIVDRVGAVKHVNYGLTDARKLIRQLQTVL